MASHELQPFLPEDRVWLRTEEEESPYALAVVLSSQASEYRCRLLPAGPEITAAPSRLLRANASIQDGCDDLSKLSHLNEATLFKLVGHRYDSLHQIYTRAGPILLALNPFAMLDIYSDQTIETYAAAARSAGHPEEGQNSPTLPPHVYEAAASAYDDLTKRGRSQSIIINGESGAGKTETAKIILRFLTHSAASASAATGAQLAERLHQSSPVLEAFGNCRTARNDNSSRFGRLTRLHFSMGGALLGGSIERYLLEKSRVVATEEGERSYHAFYQLCAGADSSLRESAHLGSAANAATGFEYLTLGGCTRVNGVDDAKEYATTCKALEGILLSSVGLEQTEIWRVLAGLLHLGNVVFEVDVPENEKGHSPVLREHARGAASVSSQTIESLQLCSAIWEVEESRMLAALLTRKIKAGPELCELRMSCAEAEAAKDALAKAAYERVFDLLVQYVNQSLTHDASVQHSASQICLLDIFGMEILAVNGFEQLLSECLRLELSLLNYANEKLQAHFTSAAISLVQAEYQSEGLPLERIEYKDNSDLIELLDGKGVSLLSLLDDQCLQAGATDASYVQLLHRSFASHPSFDLPRFGSDKFVVHHFAGDVSYCTNGFLIKNKDSLFADLPNAMRASSRPFVQALFDDSRDAAAPRLSTTSKPSGTSAARRRMARLSGSHSQNAVEGRPTGKRIKSMHFVTVGAQFRDSMRSLVSTLEATQGHFVRCIKPNDDRKPFTLFAPTALLQLRCSGVMEAVKVSQAGFPTRIPFSEFIDRYALLLPRAAPPRPRESAHSPVLKERGSDADANAGFAEQQHRAAALLQFLKVDESSFLVGRTMVFLASGVLASCEASRSRFLNRCFAQLQARHRARYDASRFQTIVRACRVVQSHFRALRARREGKRLLAQLQAEASERRAKVGVMPSVEGEEGRPRSEQEEASVGQPAALPVVGSSREASETQLAEASLRRELEEWKRRALLAEGEQRVLEEQLADYMDACKALKEENAELDSSPQWYETQLANYEDELDELQTELEKEVDAHAVAKRDLAYAHDEQLRLMQEVAALREVLDDRDAELRRAISSKDYLVQQVANLDGVGSAAKPLNQFE